MTKTITSDQEKQIVGFTEDAARKAAKEVVKNLSSTLGKDAVQKTVIEKGDELQAAIIPVVSTKLTEFLSERTASFVTKAILIKVGNSNPYFDEMFDYWEGLWRKKLGIKNPDFAGITPFVEHPGYRPLIIPKSDLIMAQRLFDLCRERFSCWKWCDGSLDDFVVKNDRDSRKGAYVAWFRDRVEADEELENLSAVTLAERNIPGITFPEREIMEYEHFDRTNGHLDVDNVTLCSGSRCDDGDVPGVDWGGDDGEMGVSRCDSRGADGDLRSRQQFTF